MQSCSSLQAHVLSFAQRKQGINGVDLSYLLYVAKSELEYYLLRRTAPTDPVTAKPINFSITSNNCTGFKHPSKKCYKIIDQYSVTKERSHYIKSVFK